MKKGYIGSLFKDVCHTFYIHCTSLQMLKILIRIIIYIKLYLFDYQYVHL